MSLIKKLSFDPETLAILETRLQVETFGGGFIGKLITGQLERKTYEKVNKALESLGGKWNRKVGGHIFATDPRLSLSGLVSNGFIEVVKEGWFFTPYPVISQMAAMIPFNHSFTGPMLEPSAGEGAIADYFYQRGVRKQDIYCIEKNLQRAGILYNEGYPTYGRDFLTVSLDELYPPGFALVVMNPPFEDAQDIDHVLHAYSMLTYGGILVSVMSEGTFFRDTTHAKDFRKWLKTLNGQVKKLSHDAFKESGTGIQSRIIAVKKT